MYENRVSHHRAVIFGRYVRLHCINECAMSHELWLPYEEATAISVLCASYTTLRIPSLRGFVILLEGKNDARGGVVSRVTIRNLAVTIRKVSNV